MDTSEKYIKMCEKAKEIQKLKPQLYHCDFYAIKGEEPVRCECDACGVTQMTHSALRIEHIWLPRQDQLQEMAEKCFVEKVKKGKLSSGDKGHIIFHFNNWLNIKRGYSKLARSLKNWPSMEQLWLAFVMKQKYNKVWDDKKEEWIKG